MSSQLQHHAGDHAYHQPPAADYTPDTYAELYDDIEHSTEGGEDQTPRRGIFRRVFGFYARIAGGAWHGMRQARVPFLMSAGVWFVVMGIVAFISFMAAMLALYVPVFLMALFPPIAAVYVLFAYWGLFYWLQREKHAGFKAFVAHRVAAFKAAMPDTVAIFAVPTVALTALGFFTGGQLMGAVGIGVLVGTIASVAYADVVRPRLSESLTSKAKELVLRK